MERGGRYDEVFLIVDPCAGAEPDRLAVERGVGKLAEADPPEFRIVGEMADLCSGGAGDQDMEADPDGPGHPLRHQQAAADAAQQ